MKKEYDIKKELKRLRSIRGTGTELVTVYMPPGFPISEEIAELRDEHGQAGNIKSKTTRLNVQTALDKIMQYLKLYRETPKNGLAVFAGNISSIQAKPDVQLFSVEPPQPIRTHLYRCDSDFLLGPLEEMMESKDQYVLLVLDGREATLGLLRGTYFTVEKKIHSMAHSKIKKGGQSAGRYSRIIEESIENYYKEVADAVNDLFAKHQFKLNGLVVGGPGPTKENFIRAKELNYQIKVLGSFDTGYTDEHMGIDELLQKAKELLSEQESVKERKIMERFMSEVAKGSFAVSGYDKVMEAMRNNNVSQLIISEEVELTEVEYRCSNGDAQFTAVEQGNMRQSKHSCGGSLEILGQKDAIESLIEMADRQGVEVVFISTNSQYGSQLLMGFQGIAALLRYRK